MAAERESLFPDAEDESGYVRLPWWERSLNGFEIRVGRWFFWLNIYGFGAGEYDDIDRQFVVYRLGWRLQRG